MGFWLLGGKSVLEGKGVPTCLYTRVVVVEIVVVAVVVVVEIVTKVAEIAVYGGRLHRAIASTGLFHTHLFIYLIY